VESQTKLDYKQQNGTNEKRTHKQRRRSWHNIYNTKKAKQNNKHINLHNTKQTFTHTLKMVGSTSKTKQKVQSLKPQ